MSYALHTYCPSCLQGEDDETTPGYKAPKKVDLQTIQQMDADDESLVKYKQQLLGQTQGVLGKKASLFIIIIIIIINVGGLAFDFIAIVVRVKGVVINSCICECVWGG